VYGAKKASKERERAEKNARKAEIRAQQDAIKLANIEAAARPTGAPAGQSPYAGGLLGGLLQHPALGGRASGVTVQHVALFAVLIVGAILVLRR
jgi:hypothetical protein